MKNKKFIAMAASVAVVAAAFGSVTAYAASEETSAESTYSYISGQENGAKYAQAEGADENADKTEFSFNKGRARGTQYADPDDETADTSGYSFNKGRQNAASRKNIYSALPEGGTKEDAEAFYEQNDIGGGAWVNGAYDESAKTSYGYIKGQQRGSSYTQDTDG